MALHAHGLFGLVLSCKHIFACAVASTYFCLCCCQCWSRFFDLLPHNLLGPSTMANSAASTASNEESWANASDFATGQPLEAVVAHTEPLETGQSVEDDGYGSFQPIGQMILGQPPGGQDDAADQVLLGQAAGSGPMSSLGSWNMQPLPSVDVQAGQSSDGQSSIGTWVFPM